MIFNHPNHISGRHSLFQFFPLLDASGARALVATQKPQSATRQRCDAMSSCRPKCTFFCTRFVFFVEYRRRSPFFQVFPCSIHLLSTSNNGSIGFIPQTTSKMISLSLSKDILFVVDLGQLEPFVGIIFDTTDSMCNVCIFRNVKEVLVRDVNTPRHPPPPWWSYDSMCNVCIFRNLKEVLVKNVNTPPPPPTPTPPDDHTTACATC